MNLATIIDSHPAERVALVSHGRETTYGDLRGSTAALRAELSVLGVGKGHVVALLCSNTPYFVISYLAAVGVGAVVAPLNPTSPAPEIEREIGTLKPSIVVLEPSAMAAWGAVGEIGRAHV